MKRSIIVISTLALLLIYMPITVFAENTTNEDSSSFSILTDSQVEFDIEQKLNGQEVTYIISIPENSEIAALQLEVSYDVTVFKYQAAKTHSLYESGIGQVNDKEKGEIVCAFISLTPLKDGGQFLEFSFTCLEATEITSKTISFDFTEVANSDGKKIDYDVQYTGFSKSPVDQEGSETTTSQPPQSETTPSAPKEETVINGATEGEPNEDVEDNYDIADEGAGVSDDASKDKITTTIDSSVSEDPGDDSPEKEQTETIISNEKTQQNESTAEEENIKNPNVEIKEYEEQQEEQERPWILWIALSVFLILIVVVATLYIIKQTKERKK